MSTQIKVLCCTWNVGSASPDRSGHVTLDSWLAVTEDEANAPHVCVVCLQEVSLSPLSWISDEWTDEITSSVCRNGRLIRFRRVRQFGIVLLIFIQPFMLPSISKIAEESVATGVGGFLGNKGAAIIRFRLYGKSICIVGSHLSAHPENLEKRNEEFHMICDDVKFSDPKCQLVLEHDYVFWLGDLNYRLCDDVFYAMVVKKVEGNRLDELLGYDQLLQEQQKGTAFVGFSEGHVTFNPTYKYDKETQQYDTSRVPSWCDRVLYRVSDEVPQHVDVTSYTSHPEHCVSDHKPVSAQLELKMAADNMRRLVEFAFPTTWICKQDALIAYSLDSDVVTSSWDWIGLYKTGWHQLSDYVTYVWAPSKRLTRRHHVPLDNDYVPKEPGLYQLIYHSNHYKQVLGISQHFQIELDAIV
ncbi:phosphatidylinositol 4,5-bisphosphate 5-phosphatase A-like [Corticium candelabrum]|uniref:phosphatidylinositol 4,5-bisphosphate 5-phosphatase A-like n=1 Tax=Corticium candelabrum TaxID=121492 RepID=UPI002E268620|nr:phosphatidylinositol 4,5-bisphosphate 5-phosphatase A-like [Corticium candelabrum]